MKDRKHRRSEKHPHSRGWIHRMYQHAYRTQPVLAGNPPWLPRWWTQRHARYSHRRIVMRRRR